MVTTRANCETNPLYFPELRTAGSRGKKQNCAMQLFNEDRERLVYRLRRYLSGASDRILDERLTDIAQNIYTFTRDGQVGLVENGARDLWAGLLAHLNIECETRGRETVRPERIGGLTFTRENLAKFLQQPDVLRRSFDAPIYCRYGDRQWMEALQKDGAALLRPASYYSSSTLNAARRDDELTYLSYVCPNDYDLGLVDARLARLNPGRSFGEIVHRKPSDHYLYSVSTGFHVRLYADFFANTCLVIRDQAEFERRLVACVRAALPDWYIEFGNVWYGDPFSKPVILPNEGAQIFFLKHIRYMYQCEFRLVALPLAASNKPLPSLPISLGDLRDITELVPLEGHPFAQPSLELERGATQ